MKPKFRNFIRKAFPSLIIVPAMMQVATAAPINTAGNGSLIVSSVDNGANHIEANGGLTPLITIQSGTNLSADPGFSAVEVNSAGYADSAYAGYFSDPGGANTIPVLSGSPALPTAGIINAGILNGADDGVEGSGFAVTVVNTGTITGVNSGTSQIGDNSFFVNTGTWSGADGNGISAFDADGVTVHNTGTITGANIGFSPAAGVAVGEDGLVINSNTISATGALSAGVAVSNGSVIYNLAGATISGGGTGISSLGLGAGITVNNWGTITGSLGTAISGGALGADTFNINYGSIINGDISSIGGDDIINVSSTYLGNTTVNGDLEGGTGIDTFNITADALGIFSYVNGEVFIDGNIEGGTGNDVVNLTSQNQGILYVSGTIEGNNNDDAIALSANFGTLIVNEIEGGSGADTISLTTLNGGSLVVLEGIDGDSGTDILNISGGLTSAPDFSGDVTFQDFIESAVGTGLNLILDHVEGIQTLNKTDGGTAFITGYNLVDNVIDASANVEVDTFNITGGGLYINGNVANNTGGLATINAGGAALGGTGTWNANVNVNAGGFSAGQTPINLDWNNNDTSSDTLSSTPVIDPIGDVTINGSLTFASGTFIRQDLDTDAFNSVAGGDLIIHNTSGGGVVTIDSNTTVRLSPTNLDQVVTDGQYTIINSDSAISGLPSNVTVQLNGNIQDQGGFVGSLNPFLSGSSTQSIAGTNLASFTTLSIVNDGAGESLIATVEHDYEGLAGLTQNQASIGAALDNLSYSSNPFIQDFIGALDLSSAQAAVLTIASLSPEGQISQSIALVNSNYRVHRLLENHLATVRAADTVRMPVGAPSAKGGEVAAPAASSNRGNVWGAISYDWQDYEDDDDNNSNSDFDGEAVSVTAGFDYRVAPQLVLGVLIDGSSGDYDYDGGGDSDVDSFRITAYGTWGAATGLYSNFAVGYGNHDLDYKHSLGGILGGSSSSSTDADSIQALWTVGYTFGNQQIKHGPFAGLEYQKIEVDGYDEDGIIPVSVDDYDVDSLRALIGYRVEGSYGRFTPYATVAYAHEFEDDDIETDASLAGAGFQIKSAGLGSAVILTAGTGYAVNSSFSLDFGYRGEISVEDEGLDSHGLSLGANWQF